MKFNVASLLMWAVDLKSESSFRNPVVLYEVTGKIASQGKLQVPYVDLGASVAKGFVAFIRTTSGKYLDFYHYFRIKSDLYSLMNVKS